MIKEFIEFLFVGPFFSTLRQLSEIDRKLKSMPNIQETVNAIAARLSGVSDQFAKGLSEVKQEIAALQDKVNAGEAVDFTSLNDQVDKLANAANELDAVVPDSVPTPEPEEVPQSDVDVEEVPAETGTGIQPADPSEA